jgi:hypothetical protein
LPIILPIINTTKNSAIKKLNKQTKEEEENRLKAEEDLKEVTIVVSPIVSKRKNKEDLNSDVAKKIKTNEDKKELFEDPKFKPILDYLNDLGMSACDLVRNENVNIVQELIAYDKGSAKENREQFMKLLALQVQLGQLASLVQQQLETQVTQMKEEKQIKRSSFVLDQNEMIRPIKYDTKNCLSYFVENLPPIAGTGEGEKATKVIRETLFTIANKLVDSSDNLADNLISTIKGKNFKGVDFGCQLKFESISREDKQSRTHCVSVLIRSNHVLLTSLVKLFPQLSVNTVASNLNAMLRNKRSYIRSYFKKEDVKKTDLFNDRVTNWEKFKVEFEKSIEEALKALPELMKKWKQEFDKVPLLNKK